MRSDNLRNNRVGSTNHNVHGSLMTVIEYNHAKDIWVVFDNGCSVHTSWQRFSEGKVTNVYDKSVFGVGYFGEGPYTSSKDKKKYNTWLKMLERSYSNDYQNKKETYKGCSVADVWHNFQEFANWFDNNYYQVPEETMCLDKDILVKGNKMYSPNNCVFVPNRINVLFTKSGKSRGSLPIGITAARNKFQAQMNINGKIKNLGYYLTIDEAFEAYKQAKETYIKEVAEEYKEIIPIALYNALVSYEVDVND